MTVETDRSTERRPVPGTHYEVDRAGRAFRTESNGALHLQGYQRKPLVKTGRMLYQFPFVEPSRYLGQRSFVISAEEIVRRVFGEEPGFRGDWSYYKKIFAEAEQHNRDLKARRKRKKKRPVVRKKKCGPPPQNPPVQVWPTEMRHDRNTTFDDYYKNTGLNPFDPQNCPFG